MFTFRDLLSAAFADRRIDLDAPVWVTAYQQDIQVVDATVDSRGRVVIVTTDAEEDMKNHCEHTAADFANS